MDIKKALELITRNDISLEPRFKRQSIANWVKAKEITLISCAWQDYRKSVVNPNYMPPPIFSGEGCVCAFEDAIRMEFIPEHGSLSLKVVLYDGDNYSGHPYWDSPIASFVFIPNGKKMPRAWEEYLVRMLEQKARDIYRAQEEAKEAAAIKVILDLMLR